MAAKAGAGPVDAAVINIGAVRISLEEIEASAEQSIVLQQEYVLHIDADFRRK
jgi:hypothetical protein